MEPLMVIRTVTLATSLEGAWRLLVDDDELSAWFGADVALDARPGGTSRFVQPDGTVRTGVVDTVEPLRRLGFVWWDVDEPDAVSAVQLSLEETAGQVKLTVTETRPAQGAHPGGGARACACAVAGSELGATWERRLHGLVARLMVPAPPAATRELSTV